MARKCKRTLRATETTRQERNRCRCRGHCCLMATSAPSYLLRYALDAILNLSRGSGCHPCQPGEEVATGALDGEQVIVSRPREKLGEASRQVSGC